VKAKVGAEFSVAPHSQVLDVAQADPGADSLRVVAMQATTTAGEVEIRGWLHRRGQPGPDWWVATVPVDALPVELRAVAL